MATAGVQIQVPQQEIQKEFLQLKGEVVKRARSQNAKLNRGDLHERYMNSIKIWKKFEANKQKRVWNDAFYCLHLYLQIVLDSRLHISSDKHKRYENVSNDCLRKLKNLEREMDRCCQGMRSDIEIQKRRALAEKLKSQELAKLKSQAGANLKDIPPPAYKPKIYSENEINNALDALKVDGSQVIHERVTNIPLNLRKPTVGIFKPGQDALSIQEQLNRGESLGYPDLDKATVNEELDLSTTMTSNFEDVTLNAVAQGQMVDSRSMLNAHVLENSVQPQSFRVHRVAGDGNCAFRALVQGFNNGALDSTAESRDAINLRKLVTKKLLQMRDEEMTGTGLTVEQIVLMDDDSSYSTFSEYLNAMQSTKYAGGTEFWVLAKSLGRRIAVYVPEGAGYREIVTYGEGTSQPIRLLWQKGMTEGGNHYDLLLPF